MDTYLWIIISISTFIFGIIFIIISDYFFNFLKRKNIEKNIVDNQRKSKLFFNKINAENKLKWEIKKNELEEKNKNNIEINRKTNKWFLNKEKELSQEKKKFDSQKENISIREEKLDLEFKNIRNERKNLIIKLEEIANLSQLEAEKELFKNIELKQSKKLNKLIKEKKNEVNKNLKTIVNNTIAVAIERYSSEYIAEKTITKLDLGNENFKGKVIGKEGRNIKKFEEISGVDIIIEQDTNIIKLSCFNPIRREIAYRALKKLIASGRIQPQSIKDFLEKEEKNISEIIKETGQKIVEELDIIDLAPELIELLGKLKFRTSYGQNVLAHSIEVAKFAGALAKELDLNDKLAVRAGLLHDIGKATDYEIGESHVDIGVGLAQKHQEHDYIINSIHSHHGDVPANNIYALLVSAADTLSAARPGSRDNVHEDYIQRMKIIEEVCNNIKGIRKCHAVKSGRIIMVFVDPLLVNDFELEKIIEKIEISLKAKLKIPGNIIIKVTRELIVQKII